MTSKARRAARHVSTINRCRKNHVYCDWVGQGDVCGKCGGKVKAVGDKQLVRAARSVLLRYCRQTDEGRLHCSVIGQAIADAFTCPDKGPRVDAIEYLRRESTLSADLCGLELHWVRSLIAGMGFDLDAARLKARRMLK